MCYAVYPLSYNYYGFPDKINTVVIAYYITLYGTNIVTSISFSVNQKKIAVVLKKLMDIEELIKNKETTEFCRKTKFFVNKKKIAVFLKKLMNIDELIKNKETTEFCRKTKYEVLS
jgi:hypothetical protein